MNSFLYQRKAKTFQTAPCDRDTFWGCINNASTAWKINARRDILGAVARHDVASINQWDDVVDYKKFLLGMQTRQNGKLWPTFAQKTKEQRLLAYADELKSDLPAFIFSSRAFDETTNKKGKTCHSRRLVGCHLSGLVMLDIDHVEAPREVYERLLEHTELMARTALVHITSSAKGLRIVFTADASIGNLADNQIVFAQQLGYQADRSCIDATRISYAPKAEDILYINEELLFGYYDEAYDREFTPGYREKKTQPLHHNFPEMEGKKQETERQDNEKAVTWRGYDIQRIIDERYAKKLPCKEDSNRHNESLKLATDLLLMLDRDKELVLSIVQRQPWVREIIDERNEDVQQTVDSAAACVVEKDKKYASCWPSKAMLDAIEKVTGKSYKSIVDGDGTSTTDKEQQPVDSDIDRNLWMWGHQIEEMSQHYPVLKDVCKGLKANQYPAALFVSGGLMMTLMTRCTYRFYHRPEELRRLNNSTLIIGDPASGKSFATRLYDLLSAPITAADQKGIEAINAYRVEMKTKGANKDKSKKPEAIVRDHPARTSNAQFIQDMVNAKEMVDGVMMQLHMLTFDTELDNTITVQKGGSWIDKQALQLKAFHNEVDGQAYSSIDSVYQKFKVFWNYIYTGTPLALKKLVNPQNFGSGLATRLSCIPLPSTNFEMLNREESIDYESDLRLRQWAEKLDRVKGELPVKKIVDELYDWTARRMENARENNSKADEMLLKRCAYHGLNFAAPFIVMRHWDELHKDGDFWCGDFQTDDIDWQLTEMIASIQYACQRHFFGAMAEAYFDNKIKDMASNTQHMQKTTQAFNRLPNVFTIGDVTRCFNFSSENSARKKTSEMLKDRIVEKISDGRNRSACGTLYRKTGMMML